MIITGCGQHDSVNESAQAISLRQQLCVNVSLQTELKDGLAADYLCSSSFLIHRRLRLFFFNGCCGFGRELGGFCFQFGQSVCINTMTAGIVTEKDSSRASP